MHVQRASPVSPRREAVAVPGRRRASGRGGQARPGGARGVVDEHVVEVACPGAAEPVRARRRPGGRAGPGRRH